MVLTFCSHEISLHRTIASESVGSPSHVNKYFQHQAATLEKTKIIKSKQAAACLLQAASNARSCSFWVALLVINRTHPPALPSMGLLPPRCASSALGCTIRVLLRVQDHHWPGLCWARFYSSSPANLISAKEKLSLMCLHNTSDRDRLIFREVLFDVPISSQATYLSISAFSV